MPTPLRAISTCRPAVYSPRPQAQRMAQRRRGHVRRRGTLTRIGAHRRPPLHRNSTLNTTRSIGSTSPCPHASSTSEWVYETTTMAPPISAQRPP